MHIYYVCLFSVFIISFAFNPIATILTQNKLIENNFIDWKCNLDIVLTVEDHAYILTIPFPDELATGATAAAIAPALGSSGQGIVRTYA